MLILCLAYLFYARVEENMCQDDFLESAEENTIQLSIQLQPRIYFHCAVFAITKVHKQK